MSRAIRFVALAFVVAAPLLVSACVQPDPGPPPLGEPAIGCYVDEPGGPNYTDNDYVGPIDTRGNVHVDEGCDGTYSLLTTIVIAADQAAAEAKCLSLTGQGVQGAPYQTIFPDFPSSVWKCVENFTP
jgi:hypothetical protein